MFFSKSKMSIVFIICLGVMFMLGTGCGSKKMILIDKSGNGDYTSIRKGLAEWEEGLPIKIMPGVYDEQIILKSKMNIEGKASGTNKVVVTFSGDGPVMAGRDVSSVKISGVELEKTGSTKHPVVALDSTDIEMADCRVANSKTIGIKSRRFGNLSLKNCVVENNEYAAIFLQDNARAEISTNIISNNARGIVMQKYPNGVPKEKTIYREDDGAEIVISKNTIENTARYGVYLYAGSDAEISGNTIKNTAVGENADIVDEDLGAIVVKDRSTANIFENLITDNQKGVVFTSSGGGNLVNNRIYNSTKLGVLVKGSSQPEILSNDIAQNASGIQLREGTESLVGDNRIRQNLENGIEIVSSARPRIERNWIIKNQKVGMVIMSVSRPFIKNNLVVENGWHGALVAKDSKPNFMNNTFYRNKKYGVWFTERSEGAFSFNVVVGSTIGISLKNNKEFLPNVKANCVWKNERGNYEKFIDRPRFDISLNPKFADPAQLDFTPLPDSPLIGAMGSKVVLGAIDPNAKPLTN